LIAAIEQMKWNQVLAPTPDSQHDECDSDEEIQKLKQRIRIRRRECMKEVRYLVLDMSFVCGNRLACLYAGCSHVSVEDDGLD